MYTPSLSIPGLHLFSGTRILHQSEAAQQLLPRRGLHRAAPLQRSRDDVVRGDGGGGGGEEAAAASGERQQGQGGE